MLGGLGSLAGGMAQGLQTGQAMRAREQQMTLAAADQAMQEEVQGRRRQEWARQDQQQARDDATRTTLEAANQEAARVLREAQAAHEADPANAGTPFQPSKDLIVRAGEARTNALFKAGRTDDAMKFFAQDSAMRASLRREAIEQNYQRYKATRDPSALIEGVYRNIDDGFDLKGVEPVKTLDGSVVYRITRQSRDNPEKVDTQEFTPDDVEMFVQGALNPQGVLKYELDSRLAREKHQQVMEQIGERGDNAMDLQGLKNKGMLDATKLRIAGSMSVAQLRGTLGAGRRGGGGGAAGGSNVHSVQPLSDGRLVAVMRNGSHQVITDDNGQPVTGLAAEKVAQQYAKLASSYMPGLGTAPAQAVQQGRARMPQAPAPAPKPAGAPGGPPRLRFDAQGNLIK